MSDQAESTLTPTASAPTQSVLIAVHPHPTPRRGRWYALAAVVVLLIGGFVTYLVTADGSSEQYSLQAAIQGSGGPRSSEFEMTFSIGPMGDVSATGRFDVDTQRMAMLMDMGALGVPALSMIVDLESGVAYVDTEGADEMGFDAPTRWIAFDAAELGSIGGLDSGSGPADMTDVLQGQQQIDDLGFEDFRGERVRHFRVSVPLDAMLAANPDLAGQMDGADLPESYDYDVYVTKDNHVRRMAFELELMGQTSVTEVVYTKFDDIDPIDLPDPADVTEQSLADV
ncbi:MAG: hypothetical protein Q7V57_09950 [Actinomycetota bacterium]|nr:hypothetical protein [Actinomycetota bacterium]